VSFQKTFHLENIMQIKRLSFALVAAISAMPLLAAQAVAPAPAYPVAQPSAPILWPLPVMPASTVPAGTSAQPVMFPIPTMPVPAATVQSQNAEKWLGRMGDFTQNASAFKDPKTFNQWFGAMTDPSIAGASMIMMMEPNSWIRMTSSMMQPGAVSNYMGFTDPNVYGRWAGAMMDPNFYMQNMWSMTDPSKMMRWMMLPMDPQFMQAGVNMMNPNTYMKWMMTPMDPRVWGLMFAPMNPQTYGSMAGALINPNSLPSAWQTFMYPGQPVVSPISVAPAPVMQPGIPAKLSLAGDTLFKSGKSSINDLTAEGKVKLDDLAGKIKAAGKIATIRIVGHADKTGKASANMTLSQKRAATVASYLKKQGVKAGKFITAGKGDTQPLVQCDSKLAKEELKACLQPNRRVEVEVTVAK
jgi:outer membrane protein OmpA-like peptidoglycan-associated protein